MSSTRARICLVAPEFIGPFPNGGVGTACYWEADTLAAAGFDVTVLYTGSTAKETPEHWEQVYRAGPFGYVDLWRWATPELRSEVEAAHHPCADARTAELVYRYLREHSFDLALFQEFLGHGFRALQARRSGEGLGALRTAVTLHSCRQWIYEGMRRLPSSPDDLAIDALERGSARMADAVVAPSRHMADWAGERWRLEPAARVVPYCYDERLVRPASVVEHRGPFEQLVFFGRLETRKGLHLFCRALADHPEARGPIRTVTFLGKPSVVEGAPSEAFIRRALAGLDIEVRIVTDLGSLEALEWLERQQRTVVVTPSLVDNLPYAVIELFARRLPLVATRIGGIPEIVGAANDHVLAEPSVEGLAAALADVHRRGGLTIDYRDGYSIAAANVAHVHWVRSLLDDAPAVSRVRCQPRCVVLVDATEQTLPAARETFAAADPSAADLPFFTWRTWCESSQDRPALFASSAVRPRPGTTLRLMRALENAQVSAATSYYTCEAEGGGTLVAPLGSSLEAGWRTNLFGGPCFAARGRALDTLRGQAPGTFRFWSAYAALACADLELAVVPADLYTSPPADESIEAVEGVAASYRTSSSRRLDLGWVLKYASAREASGRWFDDGGSLGRGLYERLVTIPDAYVEAFAGLRGSPDGDSYLSDLRRLRTRLSSIAAEWSRSHPRAFIYGAGQFARLILMLEPELGRFIAGFVDQRPLAECLGKPCIRPEQLSASTADVVLYASREFEREMHAKIASVPVGHELLFSEPAPRIEENTSTRLRRRLGHTSAPTRQLREMYRPPAWVQGGCSHGDVEFLLELVTAIDPALVLELGVASGTSSAALLFALDQLPAGTRDRVLYSGDIQRTCYFDASRQTGAAVQELYPGHRATWHLDTNTDARRVRAALVPGSVDLCFIDANHYHPWPLLDLLQIAPLLRPEAWVVLHDIELPRLHPRFQAHGPQWLFEAWPFNKIHGLGGSENIGAVQLPADLTSLVPMALNLLERPWEHTPTTWDIDLPPAFSDVADAIAPRLARPAAARAS